VDVQGVKAYDGVSRITNDRDLADPGTLQIHTMEANDSHFLGSRGNNADAMARRIAGGDKALESLMWIHPESEIRSAGDLALATTYPGNAAHSDDWVLHAWSVEDAYTSTHAGDASVTLRAAGSIDIPRTISGGFDPVYYGDDERVTGFTSQ